MGLLGGRRAREWVIPEGGRASFSAEGSYLGKNRTPLEVAFARTARRPNDGDVRNLWKRRRGHTPSPLLLVVLWPGPDGERASACGPGGAEPPVYSDRDPEQVARIAALALDEPDHHAARRLIDAYLPEEGGVRNRSLFAAHHLLDRVPERGDWAELCGHSLGLLSLRREDLMAGLGFTVEVMGPAALLRAEGNARAMALFLDDAENPEAVSTRFNGLTPVAWAIARAAADNVPYVIVARGDQLRIHAAGREATTKAGAFVELNLPLLTASDAGYLTLLFSAKSLRGGGEFERLLSESHDFALSLSDRLRNRVYDEAVPAIAAALIAKHQEDGGAVDHDALAGLYNRTLLVLFRLLFLAYAEDRGLLPLQTNDLYRQNSLKRRARELAGLAADSPDGVAFDQAATDYWDNVRVLWGAIDRGRPEWNVPPYNGGLFSSDPGLSPDGAALGSLSLTNAQFGPCLVGLLVDRDEEGYAAIDFASLDVREFGTIYEGLLESDLAVAPCDLTIARIKDSDVYVPAQKGDHVVVSGDDVYLHDHSGARKSSGSYFTKSFAVQHLLAHALEPALDSHVDRLGALVAGGDEIGATAAFFDFRCADLSMGSGHFLVAAVDHIEQRLSEFLAEHRIAGVLDELDRLAAKAAENLDAAGLVAEPADTSSLLRRQIARRCVYGVDLNPTAVELARLALWIHTFVRGLPLTSLDHGLVVGDSLTGIGTLEEVTDVLDPGDAGASLSFLSAPIDAALGAAGEALARFAAIGEADKAEIKLAREAQQEAVAAMAPAKALCDLAVAVRLGLADVPQIFDAQGIVDAALVAGATAGAEGLAGLHFPIAFPEVFAREHPGFDCILGNPPWNEATVEELGFFALRFPGLKSMRQAEQRKEIAQIRLGRPDLVAEYEADLAEAAALRKALLAGPYPGMGTGDPDLYKAFVWRFWSLVSEGGGVGVVLPRSALAAAGLVEWRETVLGAGTFSNVTMLLNNRQWVFPNVHPQYTVGLVSIRKGDRFAGTLVLDGPYRDRAGFDARGTGTPVSTEEFLSWSDGASFPLLPTDGSLRVFQRQHESPRFDTPEGIRVRPTTELHATNDKKHIVLDPGGRKGLWPVYGGRSFNLWEPDTGDYYAWADPDTVLPLLQEKRRRAARQARSAFSEFPRSWAADDATLPCLHPRIAFRDIARATDTRTIITALLPPRVILTNPAPYLLFPVASAADEAYVLGVMASIPFDWAARRVVEIHVNFHVLNSLPFPRPDPTHTLRRRVEELAGTLAAVDARYVDWAEAVGVPIGGVPEGQRDLFLAELDAAVALLYGLSQDDLRCVYSTFHDGWEYQPRLDAVLDFHRALKGAEG